MTAIVADLLVDRDHEADEDSSGISRRWGLCFAMIAALHIGGIWAALHWHLVPSPPPPPSMEAVMVDLAPLPATPPAPPREVPPTPKHEISRPPPKPVAQPVLPPAPLAPEVDLPVSAPSRTDSPPAVADAPQPQIQPAAAPSTSAVPTWQGLLLRRLEEVKRYPATARVRHQQGVAYLRFTMNRHGDVLSASIDKSSGFGVLDEETLALVRRAAPLPPPPSAVPGDPVELVVPVEFFLR